MEITPLLPSVLPHTHITAGTVTVTLTVTFGGTTQSATKTVIVNDMPTVDFTLDGSNFCFRNQNVCLTDKSTMGSTTSGYAIRTVLWGDGSVNSSLSPASNPKGPEPYFDITSDTMGCAPFTATSSSPFIWRMGDQAQTSISASKDSVFSYIYDTPGEYFIYLEGSDSFVNEAAGNTYQCSALFPDTNRRDYPYRKIIVLPVPPVSFNTPESICVGDTVLITDESDDVYTVYNWSINDVDTSTKVDLNYVFKEEGLYTVNYKPTYIPESSFQRYCYDRFSNQVEVFFVKAGFSYEEQGLCSEYIFIDSSENAIAYIWDFDHPKSGKQNTSTNSNTSHIYGQDTVTYTACLAVESREGW